jgi:hypothetical protein
MHNNETVLPGLVLVPGTSESQKCTSNTGCKNVSVQISVQGAGYLLRRRFDERPFRSASTTKYCPAPKELRTEQETVAKALYFPSLLLVS